VLCRLYLTLTHQLLGGEHFHSLIDGSEMGAAGRLKLAALYLDTGSPNRTGQFFTQFEPRQWASTGARFSKQRFRDRPQVFDEQRNNRA
jgi:hypothetical protein